MNNVVQMEVKDFVLPLPLDSLNAAQIFKIFDVMVDSIHIDGAHDYEAVKSDLNAWWPLLRPGGDLIGDDYYEELHWPGVNQAFDEFVGQVKCNDFKFSQGKCWIKKA
jgi:hypothetical protein